MSDGLTAEQEAGRVWSTKRDQIIFIRGAKWATEREKARAEAAEARVAELEAVVAAYIAAHDVLTDTRMLAEWGAWEDQERDSLAVMRALAAPTTEAVTE